MAIGKAEKDFWIDKITNKVMLDIDQMCSGNDPRVIAREQARDKIIDDYGMHILIMRLEAASEQVRNISAEMEDARKIEEDLQKEIGDILDSKGCYTATGRPVSTYGNSYRNYYSNWDKRLDARVEMEIPEVLMNTEGKKNQQIAMRMEAIGVIPGAIMAATSATHLKMVLQGLNERYDLNLDQTII